MLRPDDTHQQAGQHRTQEARAHFRGGARRGPARAVSRPPGLAVARHPACQAPAAGLCAGANARARGRGPAAGRAATSGRRARRRTRGAAMARMPRVVSLRGCALSLCASAPPPPLREGGNAKAAPHRKTGGPERRAIDTSAAKLARGNTHARFTVQPARRTTPSAVPSVLLRRQLAHGALDCFFSKNARTGDRRTHPQSL